MIKKEFLGKAKSGVNLYKFYSDAGYKILENETGIIYTEAVTPKEYTYTETTEKIIEESVEEDI